MKGIRAAVCSEPFTAKMARAHNNCNILAFGARVVGAELAKMIVEAHGGVIEVSSTLGKGTEFILTFCPQTQDSYKIVG